MINVAAAVIRHRDVGMVGKVSMIGAIRLDSEGWGFKAGMCNRVWFVALSAFLPAIPLYADAVMSFSFTGTMGKATDYTFTTCIHPLCPYVDWLAMACGGIALHPFGQTSFA